MTSWCFIPFRNLAGILLVTAGVTVTADDRGQDVMVIRITEGRMAAPVEPMGAVTTVRRDPGDAAPTATLGSLLEDVPGVFAASRFNAAQDLRMSVRGFGARGNFGIRGIRIFLDGLPLTLPDGQSAVDEVDPGALDGATVRRGPAGALYGGAAGGVVHLTSPELFAERGWHAGLGVGAWGAFDARAGSSRLWDRHAMDLSVSSRGSDGYRDHSNRLHHRLALRYGFRPTPAQRLVLSLHAVDSPYARDPGGLTAAERRDDRRDASPLHEAFDAGEEVRQHRLGLDWRRTLAGGDQLRVGGYWLDRDFANLLPFSATALEREAGGLTMEVEQTGEAALGPWRWVVGAEADLQDDRRRRFTNSGGNRGAVTARQRERVTALGLFSQLTLSPTPRLDVGLGLRADRVEIDFDDRFEADGDASGTRTFDELSPSLGASWRFAPRTRLFARLGSTFETPTTTELANPTGAGGFNAALEPQRAVGLEGGLRWDDGWGNSVEVALYHTRLRDQLVARPIPGQQGRFFFVNAASSRYTGAELDLRRRLAAGWQAHLTATVARLRFDEFRDSAGGVFDGNRIAGVPESRLTAGLAYEGTLGRGQIGYRWVGTRHADDANSVRVDDYQVVDVSVGRRLWSGGTTLDVNLGIDNLLNERYDDNLRINAAGGRHFEPAPERRIHLTLRLGQKR